MSKFKIPTLQETLEANYIISALYVFDKGHHRRDASSSDYQTIRGKELDLDRIIIDQRHERAIQMISDGRRCHTINMSAYDASNSAEWDPSYDALFVAGDNLVESFRCLKFFYDKARLHLVEVHPQQMNQAVFEYGLKMAFEFGIPDHSYRLFRINKTGKSTYEWPLV